MLFCWVWLWHNLKWIKRYSGSTVYYLSTRKGAYQQKIFAHVTDPSCVWKQYTLRYSTFFAQISHCSMKDCSNTSWTYSTSTFTVSEWRVAEAKWLFSVHFVWKNTDFPLCPCGFWRFCYHGVITISLYLSTYLYLYYLKMVSIVEHTLN